MARLNVCDGVKNCRDGSDESQCLRHKKRRRKFHYKHQHTKQLIQPVLYPSITKQQEINVSDYRENLILSARVEDKIQRLQENGIDIPLSSTVPTKYLLHTPDVSLAHETNLKHIKEKNHLVEKQKKKIAFRHRHTTLSNDIYNKFSSPTKSDDSDGDNEDGENSRKEYKSHQLLPTPKISPALKYEPTIQVRNKVTRSSKSLNLRVYPAHQEVYETGDVVIQCRDEGDLRANVYWEKGVRRHSKDNTMMSRKLPNRAVDYRGRLEISRISHHGGGTFICKAVNHEEEPGGEAMATVKVLRLP